MRNLSILTVGPSLLAVSLPAFVHHSFQAEYDQSKPLTLVGRRVDEGQRTDGNYPRRDSFTGCRPRPAARSAIDPTSHFISITCKLRTLVGSCLGAVHTPQRAETFKNCGGFCRWFADHCMKRGKLPR